MPAWPARVLDLSGTSVEEWAEGVDALQKGRSVALVRRLRSSLRLPSVTEVEPALPVVLGLHGLLMLAVMPSASLWPPLLFSAVGLLGLAGLLGWRTGT